MGFWKLAALAAPFALSVGGPGQEKLFGNWAVVCDNVKRCQATAMMPEGWSGDSAPALDLTREPGPMGAVTIALSPSAQTYGMVDILIDRKIMASGAYREGTITLTGPTAEGIARAMATGKRVTLRAHGKIVGTISLAGASAAMRHIDAEQGRAGGMTALVARGKAPVSAVPAAKPLPRIVAVRPPRGKAATLPAPQLEALRKQAGCDVGPMPEGFDPEFHRLDARSTLLILPCGMGAYQGWSALYVVTAGKAAPAAFDINSANDPSPVAQLTQAEWDGEKGVLGSHAKGRGLGDCGFDVSYVWDGNRFRLTRENGLDACRLSGNWMTRYRAEPVYR